MVRGLEVEAHQAEQRVQETLGLAKRQVEDDPQRQRGQDREVRVPPLASAETVLRRCPRGDRLLAQPDRDVAAAPEAPLVLPPVPDSAFRLVLAVDSARLPCGHDVAPLDLHDGSGHRANASGGAEDDSCTNAPGVYFRLLLIGYFEGLDSERGMAWRAADSLGLRRFLRIGLEEMTPDHSTISRTRRLIDVETHREVFTWALGVIAEKGLLEGKTLGIDATTLEANAALRSIVRRDSGESYVEFLTKLAQESGIETPTRDDLARLDRKRKKKVSNREWVNPYDPEARITKMKDGRTHLAHKAEHAVDLETGAVVAVTLQGADQGDTTTVKETFIEAAEQLEEVGKEPAADERMTARGMEDVVTDKGYHSGRCWKIYNRSGCGRIYRSRNGDDVTGKAKRASKLRSIASGGASEGTGASSSCAGEESYWKEASPMSTTRAECGARTCGGIAIS